MIIIKSPREIALMAKSGALLASLYDYLRPLIVPGVSTLELSQKAEKFVTERGGKMEEKGYYGYPEAVCASLNSCLIHGIPSSKAILKDGDILKLDIVVSLDGYMADAARSYAVGICPERVHRLIKAAEEAFYNGVKEIAPGKHLGDVEEAIEKTVKAYGYSVPRDYTGHGIGTNMHEDPYIPNYGKAGTGPILKEGMTLAIEPMLLEHSAATRVLGDGWGVVAKDKGLTAHYENTVAVTSNGYRILTLVEEGKEEAN